MRTVISCVLCLSWMTADADAEWRQAQRIYAGTIQAIAVSGKAVFAGTELDGVLVSFNDGLDWQKSGLVNEDVRAVYASDSLVYAGTADGKVYRSADSGASWTEIGPGIPGNAVMALFKKDGVLFAGTYDHGIYRSADEGVTWTTSATAEVAGDVVSFAAQGDVIAAMCARGFLRSLDDGNSWTASAGGQYLGLSSMAAAGRNFIAGSSFSIYLSADTGTTWTSVSSKHASMIAAHDSTVLAFGDSLVLSQDAGKSWRVIPTPAEDGYVISLAVSESALYCGTLFGNIFQSSNFGQSWTKVVKAERGATPRAFATIGRDLYIGTEDAVYRTSDRGATWHSVGGTLPRVNAMTVLGSALLAATDTGVYRWNDRTVKWEKRDSSLSTSLVSKIVSSGSDLYAAVYKEVFRSVDTGATWQAVIYNTAGRNYIYPDGLLATGSDVFITSGGWIFHSADTARTFTELYLYHINSPVSLVKADTNIYCAWSDFTDDMGEIPHFYPGEFLRYQAWNNSWISCTNGLPTDIGALASWGKYLFALVRNHGIYSSSDRGQSWMDVTGTLNPIWSGLLTVSGEDLVFAAGGMLWMRPVSEIITDVHDESGLSPQAWRLEQNFPNPFNPSTTISFGLPVRMFVSLKIYNIVGQEVADLCSEELSAGVHVRHWDAGAMPSGVYFCRLKAGGYSRSIKLLLVR